VSEECNACAVDAPPDLFNFREIRTEESVWFTWFDVYINVIETFGHHPLSHLVE